MEASNLGISTFQFISILIGMFTSIITLVIYFHRSVANNSKNIGIIEGILFKELKIKTPKKGGK
jgi:hypothetical protein